MKILILHCLNWLIMPLAISTSFTTVWNCNIVDLWMIGTDTRDKLFGFCRLSCECLILVGMAWIFRHGELVSKWAFAHEILAFAVFIGGAIGLLRFHWFPTLLTFGVGVNFDCDDSGLESACLIVIHQIINDSLSSQILAILTLI